MLLILRSLLWSTAPPTPPPPPGPVIYSWMYLMPNTELVDAVAFQFYPYTVRQGAANVLTGRLALLNAWYRGFQLAAQIALREQEDTVFAYLINNATPVSFQQTAANTPWLFN